MSSEKAAELRASAAEKERKREESWERSDTDGFLSQWALGIGAQKDRMAADLEEAGGMSDFIALFDADENRVKAKLIETRFGTKWMLLDADGNAVEWVEPQWGDTPGPRTKMFKLGLHEGREMAPAVATIRGSGTGLSGNAWAAVVRTDGGFPEGAVPWGS